MLDAMRRSAGTWVVKIFLGVIVLSFAVWGIGDIFRVSPDSAVAEVGDRPRHEASPPTVGRCPTFGRRRFPQRLVGVLPDDVFALRRREAADEVRHVSGVFGVLGPAALLAFELCD